MCKELGLEIQPLGQLLELEGTGGAAIPYLGFVEVNLQILGDKGLQQGCAAIGHPYHGLCWKSSGHGGFKNYRQSSELYDCGRVNMCNCDLATGSFWSSNVRVATVIPQQLRETYN